MQLLRHGVRAQRSQAAHCSLVRSLSRSVPPRRRSVAHRRTAATHRLPRGLSPRALTTSVSPTLAPMNGLVSYCADLPTITVNAGEVLIERGRDAGALYVLVD